MEEDPRINGSVIVILLSVGFEIADKDVSRGAEQTVVKSASCLAALGIIKVLTTLHPAWRYL